MIIKVWLFLVALSVAIYIFKRSKGAALVAANLTLHTAIYYLGIYEIGSANIIHVIIIESVFLLFAIEQNLNMPIITVFLVSIVYNGLMYFEYHTIYDYIEYCYEALMTTLTLILVLTITKTRAGNGFCNIFSRDRGDGVNRGYFFPSRQA